MKYEPPAQMKYEPPGLSRRLTNEVRAAGFIPAVNSGLPDVDATGELAESAYHEAHRRHKEAANADSRADIERTRRG
jgi:hypothetical protein